MRNPTDRAAGGVGLALGLFYTGSAWVTMPAGSLAAPGPGLVPLALGVILIVLSCGVLLAGGRPERHTGEAAPSPDTGRRPEKAYAVLAALVGFALVQYLLGFMASVGLALFAVLRIMEFRRRRLALAVALIGAVASHLVFETWLGVIFPKGIFLE